MPPGGHRSSNDAVELLLGLSRSSKQQTTALDTTDDDVERDPASRAAPLSSVRPAAADVKRDEDAAETAQRAQITAFFHRLTEPYRHRDRESWRAIVADDSFTLLQVRARTRVRERAQR